MCQLWQQLLVVLGCDRPIRQLQREWRGPAHAFCLSDATAALLGPKGASATSAGTHVCMCVCTYACPDCYQVACHRFLAKTAALCLQNVLLIRV
jgi:hypothetical protein